MTLLLLAILTIWKSPSAPAVEQDLSGKNIDSPRALRGFAAYIRIFAGHSDGLPVDGGERGGGTSDKSS